MSEQDKIVCWRCGESLVEVSLPFRRLEECPACRAELHVCKMCQFFDTAFAKSCREPIAEEVRDKERANFCGYFTPAPDAWRPASDEGKRAAAQLQDLFGDTGDDAAGEDPRDRLDALFGDADD